MKNTKTQAALDLMAANPSMTPYAAAKAVGIKTSTMYVGMARAEKRKCPTCGTKVAGNRIKDPLPVMLAKVQKIVDTTKDVDQKEWMELFAGFIREHQTPIDPA
jgi:hypothetical protein